MFFDIHLARMVGNATCEIDCADDRDAVLDNCFPDLRQFAIAAAFRGQVDHHRPGSHSLDHVASNKYRGFLSRNDGSGNDNVALADDLRLGVRAACDRSLRPVPSHSRVNPAHPWLQWEALRTVRRGSALVLSPRAERRMPKRQRPVDAPSRWPGVRRHRADDKNARRGDCPGGCGHHGEDSRLRIGGQRGRLCIRKSSPSTRERPCSARVLSAASVPPRTRSRHARRSRRPSPVLRMGVGIRSAPGRAGRAEHLPCHWRR